MVLLIDNYDSFTYMLRDYVSQSGEECMVVRNDEMSIGALESLQFDSILLSPGPGAPADAGITPDAVRVFHDRLPILGICLGHQAIGQFYGASLVMAHLPMHGKTSLVRHKGEHPLFTGVPIPTKVMRYHSLILENVPADLDVIAETTGGEVMAIAHREKRVAGLQFHPESILTPDGLRMIKNWFAFIRDTNFQTT